MSNVDIKRNIIKKQFDIITNKNLKIAELIDRITKLEEINNKLIKTVDSMQDYINELEKF